jgi:hypothetical protein
MGEKDPRAVSRETDIEPEIGEQRDKTDLRRQEDL